MKSKEEIQARIKYLQGELAHIREQLMSERGLPVPNERTIKALEIRLSYGEWELDALAWTLS